MAGMCHAGKPAHLRCHAITVPGQRLNPGRARVLPNIKTAGFAKVALAFRYDRRRRGADSFRLVVVAALGQWWWVLPRVLRFALFAWMLPAAVFAATPWPHEVSDLPPDPAVIWGRLDNGLRYAIRPNAEPKGRASLRLVVLAGSLHETEEQRGLAHFVEHMAFNGTRLYPKETLTGVLQKFGMASGADANAATSFLTTVYRLEMPVAQAGRLAEGLQVLREFADGVTFDDEEVARERGVIESERLARNTESVRTGDAMRKFLFPDGLLGKRSPIGTSEVIRNATPDGLRAFYSAWYRADNMLVMVVGDFDAAVVEAELRGRFASLAAPATPLPAIEAVRLPAPAETIAHYYRDNEAKGAVSVRFFAHTPTTDDNRARRVAGIARQVSFSSMDLRLQSARLREGNKFGVMDVNVDSSPLYQEAVFRIDANGRHWRDAVTRGEQELRRALTHGFTAAEINEVNVRALTSFEHAVRTAATRSSGSLVDSLVDSVLRRRVFTTPETNLELVRAGLAAATPAASLEAFRGAWGQGKPRIFVSGTLPANVNAEQVARTARDSARKRVAPPGETAVAEFGYTDFGPPGKVARREHIADLDIHCVEFANGVKLNLKFTRFSAGSMLFAARFGGGWAGEPAKKPGLRFLMGHGFAALGLGRHKRDALNHLSAGVVASFQLGQDEEAFTAEGSADRDGAARWMQLLTAYLNDPGWHKEELPEIQKRFANNFTQRQRDTNLALSDHLFSRLSSRDARYTTPNFKEVSRYSVADLRAWVEPQLKAGPLEIGVVGDFDVEEMIELAASTVGCLPPRGPAPAIAPVKFVTTSDSQPLKVNATTRNGSVLVVWALPSAHEHADRRRDSLLAEILENRLVSRIREEMGATYAPSCSVWRSQVQRKDGYLIASLTCEPAEAQRVAEAVRQVADELSRGPITGEELERARQPAIQAEPARMANNAYWLNNAVLKAQSQPKGLDFPRTALPDLERLTPADMAAHAAQVLPAGRAGVFTAVPNAAGKK
jgi:zinc protease